jgi:succinyl-CoA synthetase beta subunit
MRLHEFEAADILESVGIPVPGRGVAGTVEEAFHVAGEIGYPVMLKAQVLVGGRGLAGGIKTASNQEELEEMAEALLGSEIKGLPVRKILVTEKAEISKELYVGITVDGYSGRPVIVASTEGGVHIEETGADRARKNRIHPGRPFIRLLSLPGPNPLAKTGVRPTSPHCLGRCHLPAL